MTVEAIIIDLGGTFIAEAEPVARREWEVKLGWAAGDLDRAVDDAIGFGWSQGRSEKEIHSRLEQATGLDRNELLAMLEDFHAHTYLDPIFALFIERARSAYRVAALSNAGSGLRAAMVKKFDLETLVDLLVVSGEEGIEKPDPDIYLRTAARLGAPPSRCVFVDDVAANVEGAIAAGMMGIQHHDTPSTLVALRSGLGVTEHAYRAAGGVVLDGNGVLLLRRASRSEWRLPKGHVELGEADRDAATREVAEESGYADLLVERDLGTQRIEFGSFVGGRPGVHIDRDEHYFAMHLRSQHVRSRSIDDEKFEPTWVSIADAQKLLTFESECAWLQRALA